MSPLSYAVKPFKVDLGERRQAIALSLPEKVKPGTQLDIDLKLPSKARVVVFGLMPVFCRWPAMKRRIHWHTSSTRRLSA